MTTTRDEMEDTVLELLWANTVTKVAPLVCEFEVRQDRPRGLNVPWGSGQYQARLSRLLSMMFEVRPSILGTLTDEQWRTVGVRAAMLECTGAANLPKRFTIPDVFVGNMKADAVARMIIFRVTQMLEQESWQAAGVTKVSLMVANGTCEFCAELDAASYHLAEAPKVPHPNCTHKMGCRCCLSPVFDDD